MFLKSLQISHPSSSYPANIDSQKDQNILDILKDYFHIPKKSWILKIKDAKYSFINRSPSYQESYQDLSPVGGSNSRTGQGAGNGSSFQNYGEDSSEWSWGTNGKTTPTTATKSHSMKTKGVDSSLIDFGESKAKKVSPKARTAEEEAWDMLNSWIFMNSFFKIFFFKKKSLNFQFCLCYSSLLTWMAIINSYINPHNLLIVCARREVALSMDIKCLALLKQEVQLLVLSFFISYHGIK